MGQSPMEPSQSALPHLSSYLPSTSCDVKTSGMTTTDTDGNSRLPTKKRRNSVEGTFSALSPKMPTPPRHIESELRKRKQVSSSGSQDYESEETNAVPNLRLDQIYSVQDRQPSPLTTSEGFSMSRSLSQGGNTPSVDSIVYHSSEFFQPITPRRERTSRYLSEGDRREIITRIDNGEKQVTLAREFSVSRAAICNLYKNRWEVLTRGSRDPAAKHPKKSRSKRSTGSPQLTPSATPSDQRVTVAATPPYPDVPTISIQSDQSDHADAAVMSEPLQESKEYIQVDTQQDDHPGRQDELGHHNRMDHHNQLQQERNESDQLSTDQRQGQISESVGSPVTPKPFLVHEASAYSYPCRNLVATLRDANTSTAVFQQRSTRLVRLLLEEVLTCLPYEDVEITNEYGDVCHATKTLGESDICAITMEDKGMVLLHAFSDICPMSPTGVISIENKSSNNMHEHMSSSVASPKIHAQLPCIRPQHAVLLLDIQCATGEDACAVLHHLVHDKGIAEMSIYFVTVISSFEGLQNVFRHFPDITLITAQVDTVVDEKKRIRPGIGDFAQRYWNLHTWPARHNVKVTSVVSSSVVAEYEQSSKSKA